MPMRKAMFKSTSTPLLPATNKQMESAFSIWDHFSFSQGLFTVCVYSFFICLCFFFVYIYFEVLYVCSFNPFKRMSKSPCWKRHIVTMETKLSQLHHLGPAAFNICTSFFRGACSRCRAIPLLRVKYCKDCFLQKSSLCQIISMALTWSFWMIPF